MPSAEREEGAGRAGAGRGRSVSRLPAAGEGPAPGGAAAGPGRAGSEGSAETGDGAEVGAPFHPLPPSGPAPALPPELWVNSRSASVVLQSAKLAPRVPTGLPSGGSHGGLLPAVASAQEVPGAGAQLRKTRLRGRSLSSSPSSGRSEAGPAQRWGALRPVVGRRRCGEARGRGRGRGGRGAAASRERPEAIPAGPGGTSPLLPSSRPPRSELGPEQRGPRDARHSPGRPERGPPLAARLPGTRTRAGGGGAGGRGGDWPKCFLAVGFALLRF